MAKRPRKQRMRRYYLKRFSAPSVNQGVDGAMLKSLYGDATKHPGSVTDLQDWMREELTRMGEHQKPPRTSSMEKLQRMKNLPSELMVDTWPFIRLIPSDWRLHFKGKYACIVKDNKDLGIRTRSIIYPSIEKAKRAFLGKVIAWKTVVDLDQVSNTS